MKSNPDMLYSIFEQHLFNALVEDETTEEFLTHVVRDYLDRLSAKTTVPREYSEDIALDLRDEVLEMLRKKIYGHFNLSAFRKALNVIPCDVNRTAATSPSRRRRDS